jgi:NTP pyrophosphatase (non-canonical NTP hydrolase)
MQDDDNIEDNAENNTENNNEYIDNAKYLGDFTGDVSDIIGWNYAAAVPRDTRKKTKQNALKQIREEVKELSQAIQDNDEVEQLDALIDIVWVCVGYAFRANMDIEGALAEVFYSNQTKILLNSRLDYAEVDMAQLEADGKEGLKVVEADYGDIDQDYFLFRTGTIQDANDKVQKPLGYEPPDLHSFVNLSGDIDKQGEDDD